MYRQELVLIKFKNTYNKLNSGGRHAVFKTAKAAGKFALATNPAKKAWAILDGLFVSNYSPSGQHFYLCGYGRCDVLKRYSW